MTAAAPRRGVLRAALAALVRGARSVPRPAAEPHTGATRSPEADTATASADDRVFCCGGTAPRCFCPADPRHH